MIAESRCPNCGHLLSSLGPVERTEAEVVLSGAAIGEPLACEIDGIERPPEGGSMPFSDAGEKLAGFAATDPMAQGFLKLTDRQLRDVLYSASSMGTCTVYVSILILIALAFQCFLVVVGTISFINSTNFRWGHLALLAGSYVVAITTFATALLLVTYGSRWRDFVRTKKPESLIATLQSGSRFWLWIAIAITFAVALGIMTFFTLVFDYT